MSSAGRPAGRQPQERAVTVWVVLVVAAAWLAAAVVLALALGSAIGRADRHAAADAAARRDPRTGTPDVSEPTPVPDLGAVRAPAHTSRR